MEEKVIIFYDILKRLLLRGPCDREYKFNDTIQFYPYIGILFSWDNMNCSVEFIGDNLRIYCDDHAHYYEHKTFPLDWNQIDRMASDIVEYVEHGSYLTVEQTLRKKLAEYEMELEKLREVLPPVLQDDDDIKFLRNISLHFAAENAYDEAKAHFEKLI